MQGQHDLRRRGDIVARAYGYLVQRGVGHDLEDVAVVGDHPREILRTDAQYVEMRFGLVEIGDRRRECVAQRFAGFARPFALFADYDHFVGRTLRGLERRSGKFVESVAGGRRNGDACREEQTDGCFHGVTSLRFSQRYE